MLLLNLNINYDVIAMEDMLSLPRAVIAWVSGSDSSRLKTTDTWSQKKGGKAGMPSAFTQAAALCSTWLPALMAVETQSGFLTFP